jgi:hypothetical protein
MLSMMLCTSFKIAGSDAITVVLPDHVISVFGATPGGTPESSNCRDPKGAGQLGAKQKGHVMTA